MEIRRAPNPCTDAHASRRRSAPLRQQSLTQAMLVMRVGSAAALGALAAGDGARAGRERREARARLQAAEVAGEDGEMASSASGACSGHDKSAAGSRTRQNPSVYGGPRGSTEAARRRPQCGARIATGTSRTHTHAFSTVANTRAEGGQGREPPDEQGRRRGRCSAPSPVHTTRR
jgi:hypothetical protein